MVANATAVDRPAERKRNLALHVALWIVQSLLALAFGYAGFMKLTFAVEDLVTSIAWAADVPEPLLRFIGAAELAGAIGMLLPALTRIAPVLTPLAGVGLAVIMALAAAFHVTRGEAHTLPIHFVLGGLAAFVAWGRFRKEPITPRA